ncbi:DmpA family aminopeptidase [Oryzifoliimicrobium ureilyticus]|uniref:DmpA family aminopeptidase n=1 Tax=Oryzifoliimicrobium ureilyticus TaxID=3113724 RepID=UPI003076476E
MSEEQRVRVRGLGVEIGRYEPGPLNAITDIEGVRVGHVTCVEGDRVRTGATVIIPHGGNVFADKVPAGFAVYNGFGKFAGSTQIIELGEIETPIVLTNTLAVGRAIEAVNQHVLQIPGNHKIVSLNAVVGETNDGRLNDIRGARPTIDEIRLAIETAHSGPVEEGAVGAGTGTVAFGLKGGIGTSSRQVNILGNTYVAGVLVQSNYGGTLAIAGRTYHTEPIADKDGSIVIIVATDAPLCSRNLTRLAQRCFGGLAKTGAALSNGSGDYALALSTAEPVRRTAERRRGLATYACLSNEAVSPLFEAVIEATEEAILNSLTMAKTTKGFNAVTGRNSTVPAISLEYVKRLFA